VSDDLERLVYGLWQVEVLIRDVEWVVFQLRHVQKVVDQILNHPLRIQLHSEDVEGFCLLVFNVIEGKSIVLDEIFVLLDVHLLFFLKLWELLRYFGQLWPKLGDLNLLALFLCLHFLDYRVKLVLNEGRPAYLQINVLLGCLSLARLFFPRHPWAFKGTFSWYRNLYKFCQRCSNQLSGSVDFKLFQNFDYFVIYLVFTIKLLNM
jgi:hypothetical protein